MKRVPCILYDRAHRPVIAITVDHRTKSERSSHVTGHVYCWSNKMSDQPRVDAEAAKKRSHHSVLKTTVDKWIISYILFSANIILILNRHCHLELQSIKMTISSLLFIFTIKIYKLPAPETSV